MQYRSSLNLLPEFAGLAVANSAFVPVPAFLMAGMGMGAWQVYRQAWLHAMAAVGPQPLRVSVADLPRFCRN